MTIQWFPGHMNKARIMIEENIKHVDLVIELKDARIPLSSSNPLLNKIIASKKRLVILNKKDLSDTLITKQWLNFYQENQIEAISLDSLKDNVSSIISTKVKEMCQDVLEKAKRRGILNKTLKVMVVGIPNVGKSSFINKIVKKAVTKVENRPGVTKKINWIKIHKDIDLLDTPGVLWPSFQDEKIGLNLGLIGSINDNVMDKERLVFHFLEYIILNYPNNLIERYNLAQDVLKKEIIEVIEAIGENKLLLTKQQDINNIRVYETILTDLRNNRLGAISYEKPE